MPTVKILKVGAFRLDSSKDAVSWGSTYFDLGAGNGFPYLSMGTKKTVVHEEDASVHFNAFKDTPRLVGTHYEDTLSAYWRFTGNGDFLYWAFGMESAPIPVCVIAATLSDPDTGLVLGDTYEDGATNGFTFIRREVDKEGNYQYVFRCDDDAVISGNLTLSVGTGDASVTVASSSASGGLLYEHLYSLDAKERHQTSFNTAGVNRYSPDVGEDSELQPINSWGNTLEVGDVKCRRAIIGQAWDTGDYAFINAMCKKISFSSEAGSLATMEADYVAHSKEDSGSASSTWTPSAALINNDNVLGHHDFKVVLATADSPADTGLGVTSFNVGIDIPLKIEQDTVSGLYIEEPVFEGNYEISCSIDLSRHSSTTFEGYRDNWTTLCAAFEAFSNWTKIGLYIESCKLDSAGPSDDVVSKEQLNLIVGASDADVFTESLYGFNNVQGSPVLLLVRDSNSKQDMCYS